MDNLEKYDPAVQRGLNSLCLELWRLAILEMQGLREPFDWSKVQSPLTTEDDQLEKSKAQQLLDKYNILGQGDKEEFFDRFGNQLTAVNLFRLVSLLSKPETKQFSDMVFESISIHMIPVLIEDALDVVRNLPEADRETQLVEVLKRSSEARRFVAERLAQLEQEKFAQKRNRKSSNETIRRNVEICNLRIEDEKLWSQGKLAKKYEMSPKGIRNILAKEPKWRKLYAQLDED